MKTRNLFLGFSQRIEIVFEFYIERCYTNHLTIQSFKSSSASTFIEFLEELSSSFSSTDRKLKCLHSLLLMFELLDCPVPCFSVICLSVAPLSDCFIIFSLCANDNDNTTRFLLQAEVNPVTHSQTKQHTDAKEYISVAHYIPLAD